MHERADASTARFARHGPFAFLLLITGSVGWVASAVLVLERLSAYEDPGHVTSCDVNPWVSCGQVFKTWQASVFGFPNPLIGIIAFAVVITTAMVLLSGARLGRWYWVGLQAGVTTGFAFVVWLWSQAVYDIYILCIYCMIVWAMMIPLFILLTIRNLIHGIIKAPPAVVQFVADWAWTIVALIWVATAASVFFRFLPVFIR
ncbi:vitamin K epoxide reductase family protein [Arthrobacter sp. 35/47]|uniref:vitamin K epoxide reductase family protein n=1 Tax=Arthrobacter sp. 35/47 TaxID=269454 RepID=UPI000560EB69|nr:vitamin K epoxide reductase family protein [Arthrobacter sp. 35/47]